MKVFWLAAAALILPLSSSNAQYTAQREAMYIATLKAVVNYKIDDEENIRDMESLRQNQRFNEKLSRMMAKLSNSRTKNSTNSKIYRILLQAGKEIYNELD